MKDLKKLCRRCTSGALKLGMFALVLVSLMGITGCQVDVGGQTLPSPYYMTDDVQYFAPGSEFILENEAAAMRDASREEDAVR